MKDYKSKKFVHKIEVNLANISVKPTDKFQLIRAYYDINLFDCELCGHKNVMYAYEVKNLETEKVIKVGSECVAHFSDKGVDIDVAQGLMRRVTSASNKARRDLKKRLGMEAFYALPEEKRVTVKSWEIRGVADELGKEAYKALDKKTKQELVINEYLVLQTKELLSNVAYRNSILSEEDVELILQLEMEDDMMKALETQERMIQYN